MKSANKESKKQPVKNLKIQNKELNPFQVWYKCELPGNGRFLVKLLRKHPIAVKIYKNNPEKVRDKMAFILGLFVRKSQKDDFLKSGRIQPGTFRICTKYLHLIVRDYRV